LAWRIALVTVACAALSTLLMVRAIAGERTRAALQQLIQTPRFALAVRAACADGAPSEFGPGDSTRARVRVYSDRGVPRDGGAVPTGVAAVVAGAERDLRISLWGFAGSALVVRRAAAGPCALASVEILASGKRDRAAGLLAGLVFGASALAYALTVLVAIRPLTRRIGLVARSAAHVGEPGFTPAPAGPHDELATIGAALAASHRRVIESQAAARASSAALERHLHDIAHDLRTPTTALSLALERARHEPDPAARAAAVDDALRDASYLGALVENLELETRVKGGRLRRAEVDVRAIVADVIARARALGQQSGVAVDGAVPDTPVVRVTDPLALSRALSNLAENAVRHGARQVGVVLAEAGGGFRVEIRDDGAGDPATFRTGRGLAITRLLADALGLELGFGRTGEGLLVTLTEARRAS
jgi:signal transduction histidine kinase